jgi:DNA replicative helicase MCM subunit Mcm2 (Cdc46/Mcm family)
VRQLESMIRLAEARARLELQEVINVAHVREAARLLKMSIVHVESGVCYCHFYLLCTLWFLCDV